MESKDIRVGDLLMLRKNERVPADGVLLHTTEVCESIFVQTDQLDGETDWKIKESLKFTQNVINKNIEDITNQKWHIVAEAPNDRIYKFNGNFYGPNNVYEPISISNLLLTNMKITSGANLMIVTYTGKETKIGFNSRQNSSKYGKTDREINKIFIFTFCIFLIVFIQNIKRQ